MTLRELCLEVGALGFEESVAADTRLLTCANRALARIAADRPITRNLRLLCEGDTAIRIATKIVHAPGVEERMPLEGAAYSCKVTGAGTLVLCDGVHTVRRPVSGPYTAVRGFLLGPGSITLQGDRAFTVRDLSVFRTTAAGREEDIPLWGDPPRFDLRDSDPRFFCFCELPRDSDGRPLPGAELTDHTMTLPRDFSGEVSLTYRICPTPFTEDEPDRESELPPMLCFLLPLLTAAYYWLDDEPDRAQYYLALYREGIDSVRRLCPRSVGGEYEDVTGW